MAPIIHPNRCTLCEIGLGKQDLKTVPGEGPSKSDIMIMGDSPSTNDARLGQIFTGKVGNALNSLLKEAGITREDVYITNATKCCPYEIVTDKSKHATQVVHREPTKLEIRNCQKFLKQEIDIVQPKVIIAMGHLALAALEGKSSVKINQRKGIPNTYKNTNTFVMPTLHPNFIRRHGDVYGITSEITPSAKEVIEHLKEAKRMSLDNTLQVVKQYLLVDSKDKLDLALSKIREKGLCTFDVETTGLKIQDDILGIGFGIDIGVACYVPFLTPPLMGYGVEDFWEDKDIDSKTVLSRVCEVLADSSIKKAAHNSKFDMRQIKKKWNTEVQGLIWDTMCGAYLLDENSSHKLNDLKNKFTDLLGYSDAWNSTTGGGSKSSRAPVDIIYMYCCGDCDATYRLAKEQSEIFRDHPNYQWLMENFYVPLMYFITDFEYEGVYYNKERAKPLGIQLGKDAEKLQEEIWRSVGLKFNIDSPDDVSNVLYTILKLKPIAWTDGGKDGKNKKPSTDAPILAKYALEHPVPKMITDYRHLAKMKSTYVERLIRELDENNRVHFSINPIGTVTGRPSSKGLMNIPREEQIKRLWLAPPGYKLVQGDLSQAEVRCFAHYANEEVLRSAFEGESVDIHCLVAAEVNGITYDEFVAAYESGSLLHANLRQAAKGTVFGLLYGRGTKSIANEYGLTLEEAQLFMNKFFNRFPNCDKWIKDTHLLVEATGQVHNIFGRVRRIPEIYSQNNEVKARAKRQAVNSIIQATASDITSLSLIKIHQYLKEHRWPAKIVLTVYDSIVPEVRDDYVEPVIKLLRDTMETKPTSDFSVKMRCDIDVYQEWGIKLKA